MLQTHGKRQPKTMIVRCLLIFLSIILSPVNSIAQSVTLDAENAIRLRVAELWVSGKYDKLDAMADEFRRTKALVPGGRWKLSVFYEALGRQARPIGSQEAEWDDLAMQVKHWTRIAPKSPTAHLQFAKALIARAWFERGDGYANEVAPRKMQSFSIAVRAAREYLELHREVASVDPHWHELMIKTTTWIKEFTPLFESQLRAALSAQPLYWDHYFAGAEHHMPMWGGSTDNLERFAADSVARLPVNRRDSYYAAIYWFVLDYAGDSSAGKWKVDCDRWMRGLADIVSTYPDRWNLNNAARFTSSCDARVAALAFLQEIGENPLLIAWGSERSAARNFARFKAWATLGPYFLSPDDLRPARNLEYARGLTHQADALLGDPLSPRGQLAGLLFSINNFKVVLRAETAEHRQLAERAAKLADRLRTSRAEPGR